MKESIKRFSRVRNVSVIKDPVLREIEIYIWHKVEDDKTACEKLVLFMDKDSGFEVKGVEVDEN
jgi:hypothetical protein